MEIITSVTNELVKKTARLQQRKYRDSEKKFLLEGFKTIEEAFWAGLEIEYVFVLDKKQDEYSFLGDKIILTNETVLEKISTTDTAPEAVGVAKQVHYSLYDIKDAQRVVLLENIRDLGNLGSILRTSAAFGVDAVVLFGDCADIYNPKCVRSSAGNLWKVPVVEIKDLAALKRTFANYQRVATLPAANNMLQDFKLKTPSLIMFGSEADGLSKELIYFATDEVKIEMTPTVESLNLSVSCAVVLYKIFIV